MVSIIHNPSSITLFSKVFDKFCEDINERLSSDLIGGFISAIKMFSQEFGQNEIKQIEMSTLKFLMYEKEGIMIFFILDNDDNIIHFKKSLIICLNAFLDMFPKEVLVNVYEISNFVKFNPVLHEILAIAPEKIEESCLNCSMGMKEHCLFTQVKQKISEYKNKSIIRIKNLIKNSEKV